MPSEEKCEACGLHGPKVKHTLVRTLNGSLRLCSMCLANINGKNPELIELRKAVHTALYKPAHLPGCLWLKNRNDVCQCGSHERVNAAMDELRRLVPFTD